MKLRIGDKVRFLNETGEGVVSRIKDKLSVFVEMPDGFEIPYLAAQLVPIHTELIIDKDADNIELNPDVHFNDAIYFLLVCFCNSILCFSSSRCLINNAK